MKTQDESLPPPGGAATGNNVNSPAWFKPQAAPPEQGAAESNNEGGVAMGHDEILTRNHGLWEKQWRMPSPTDKE